MACLLRRSTALQAAAKHRAIHSLACAHYPAPLQKPDLSRSAPGVSWRNSQTGSRRYWTSLQSGGNSSSPDTAPAYGSSDFNVSTATGTASTGVDPSSVIPTANGVNQLGAAPVAAKSPFYYLPMAGVQGLLVYLHFTQGLPPWACFAALSVLVRVCTFPLQVSICKANLILSNYSPQLQEIQGRMLVAQQDHDIAAKRKVVQDMEDLYKEMGVKPFSAVTRIIPLALTQMTCFVAIRDLTLSNGALEFAGLSTGGCLWFTDLTVPDPFFVLPLTLGSLFMYSSYFGMETGTRPEGAIRVVVMAIAGASMIFTSQFPAALQVFWVTNIFCGIFAGKLMRHPQFRKWAGIPEQIRHSQLTDPMKKMEKMMTDFFPRKNPKPPGPAADMGDRVKYIAKGMQRELAKEEEVKAKSAREFKGFTAGLEAAKRRQAARAKKND